MSRGLCEFPQKLARGRLFVRLARPEAPNRTGPCSVAFRSSDDMDMQLPDDVAERADIDLRNAAALQQRVRDSGDFLHQERPLVGRKIDDLDEVGATRNED